MSRCSTCPVRAGLNCYEDPAMCRRASSPGEAPFRAILARHAEVRHAQSTAGVAPTSAETMALIARMKACPHWVKRTDCGCGVNQCLAGKGKDGLVGHRDCFACLSSRTED